MLPAALSAVATTVVIVLVGRLLTSEPALTGLDGRLAELVTGSAPVPLAVAAVALDRLFGPSGQLWVGAIAGLTVLAWRRSWIALVRTEAIVWGGWLASMLCKRIVERPRPSAGTLDGVHLPASFSYPSGHTALAVALGCAIVACAQPGRERRTAVAGAIVLALATAVSRVHLGVHFPSDTLASMVLVVPLSIAIVRITDVVALRRPRTP